MASILDSVKTVVGDSHPFFKMASFAIIIFLVTQLETLEYVPPLLQISAVILTFFGFLGFVLLSVHNSVNEQNIIMPNLFNPLKLIWVGINGTLSLLPFLALVYFGITWVSSLLKFAPWINYLITLLVGIVLIALFVVSMLLFCKRFNPLASYNFKNIFKYAGDFIAYSFVLAINVLILLGVVFFPIGLGVKLMFGYGPVFNFFIIFTIIFIIMTMSQYYAQLHFEFIDLSDT